MSEEDTSIESTLAQLADLDVTDIAEIRSEQFPMGMFGWKVVTATGPVVAKEDKDGNPRAEVSFELECIEVISLVSPTGVDAAALVGRKHTEKTFILLSGDEFQKGVGRVRAFIADIGGNNEGKLGAIIAGTQDVVFKGAIIHQTDKNDRTVKYARLKLAKKAGAGASATANV